jgi:glycerol-3-phosphate dehydrogenase (NAD(P)+)
MVELGQKYDVELPICETIYRSLYENADIQQGIDRLFTRTLKTEF